MPTGYTDGILKGKIKTFPQFATQCMRAMMPCIHLKEEDLDKGYVPRKLSSHYTESLEKSKKERKVFQALSDKQIVLQEKLGLKDNLEWYKKKIKETDKDRKNLKSMLDKVVNWTPPTPDHAKFRQFMMQQLETTIDHDGDSTYYRDELEKIKTKLKNINAQQIRDEKIKKFTHDIEYYTNLLNEDIKNCNLSNKWCNDVLKSLKQK